MDQSKLFKSEFNQMGTLWKRGIAYIADGLVLLIPSLFVFFAYVFIISKGDFSNIAQLKQPENIKSAILLEMILGAIALAYFTYFIGKTGQTPGKKAMGLKVVNLNGEIIGYKRAFLRYLFFVLYGLVNIGGIIFIVSIIMAVADKQRRSLHDRVCKTFVVGKGQEEAVEKVIQEGKPRIAGAAIFALFLSIFCICVPIIGQLICFYVALRVLHDIKQSKGLLKGKSLAVTSIIISAALLIAFVVLISIAPSISSWKAKHDAANREKSLSSSAGGLNFSADSVKTVSAESLGLEKRLFLTLKVDKTHVFVNEQIPLSVKFYVDKLNVIDIWVTLHQNELSNADLGEPAKCKEEREGVVYDVLEFKTSIFGTKPGNYRIGPAKAYCGVITKKSLPKSGKYEKQPVELKSEYAEVVITKE